MSDNMLNNLSTFKPLDQVQVLVIQYCQALVTCFASIFRNDWHTGLSLLAKELVGTKLRVASFNEVSVTEGFTLDGVGYKAVTSFTMTGAGQGKVSIDLTITARFTNAGYLVVCCLGKGQAFSPVFNERVEFSEGAGAVGERLVRLHGVQIFEQVNAKLGLVGDLPRLKSIGLVIK